MTYFYRIKNSKHYKTLKAALVNFITRFDKEDKSCPIGLKSLGLRVEYLNGLYKNKFSKSRFSQNIKSPVSGKPMYFNG